MGDPFHHLARDGIDRGFARWDRQAGLCDNAHAVTRQKADALPDLASFDLTAGALTALAALFGLALRFSMLRMLALMAAAGVATALL